MPVWPKMMFELLTALNDRIGQFSDSGDASAVLDSAAPVMASQLWEAVVSAATDRLEVPTDVLAVLAYLHTARLQVLPDGGDWDQRIAHDLFDLLVRQAPERVQPELREVLTRPRIDADDENPDRLTIGADVCYCYHVLTGRREALDATVTALENAIALTPAGRSNLVLRLARQQFALSRRFEQTGNGLDLDAAITAAQRLVELTPAGHPEHAERLSDLASALHRRFELAGDGADLDAAIRAARQAAEVASPGDPDLNGRFYDLGVYLAGRFEQKGGRADLDAAIDATQRAVAGTPPGHSDHGTFLSGLGNTLLTRFEQDGDRADLDAAIDAAQRAVETTAPDEPGHAANLTALGNALLTSFEQAGRRADLDTAMEAAQRAVEVTPPGHANYASYLTNLGNTLIRRFELAGDRADLDAAIEAARQAVAASAPSQPRHAGLLENLGNVLRVRFEQAGDPAGLDAAIEAGQQAVAAIPPGRPDHAGALANLGIALHARFERSGDRADLDEAVEAAQRALDATYRGHPDRAGRLSNLGYALRARFELDGNDADLDASIDAGRLAVDAAAGQTALGTYLSNLAAALHRRFEQNRDRADLDAAIDADQRAVAASPAGQPDLAMYLGNLGNSLLKRFEADGLNSDLDAAISVGQRAVDATAADHPNLSGRLAKLAGSLVKRFEHFGEPHDLAAAISTAQHSLEAAAPDHPNRAEYLSILGAIRLAKFGQSGEAADLEAAISAARDAVGATLPGHPDLAVYLSNVGNTLRQRIKLTGNDADVDAAINALRNASAVTTGIPGVRLAAARDWGVVAADAHRVHEAAQAYATAVGLVPAVMWHGLNRETRAEGAAQWAGLASDAAACAILDGRPELAVELLERGRSVLWTQASSLRGDLSRLSQRAPELAERLDNIRTVLDSAMPEAGSLAAGERSPEGTDRSRQIAAELRRGKAREWDDTLAQVRAMEGFEHFLAGVPYPELATVAVDGPVVILNTSRYGCHALILSPGTPAPMVIHLPDVSLNAAEYHANRMLAELEGIGGSIPDSETGRNAVLDILDWLWKAAAQPVLVALGYDRPSEPGYSWPRIWWYPTGPLSILPIHAAGHYPHRSTDTVVSDGVLDRVISSYTPTLAALARARDLSVSSRSGHLGVGMPITPGLAPLPGAAAELDVLARHFPPSAGHRQLVSSQATRRAVLEAMPAHAWLHMACHARQQHADPDFSGFDLWDGELTIADLAAQPTSQRGLAFLSACQTAAGGIHHLDEAIHLAAAMQFLGYRHVISTMWAIEDSPAAGIADAVYTALDVGDGSDANRAAEALHHAIRSLYRADPANPLQWAPYIHLGP
jgi:hypothetical protein